MTTPGGGRAGPARPAAPRDRAGPPPAEPAQAIAETFDSGIGASPVGPPGITLVAIALVVIMVLTVSCLIAIWPASAVTTATVSHVAGLRLTLDREQRLFVVVALTGLLGGLIHSARSLYAYVGNRKLRRSWLLMYLSLPFIGSALAVVFYVILRGGLVTGTAAQVNFFGFAAISALVGLFSSEAAEKLKQIFSTLLAHVPHERDSLVPAEEVTVYGIEPPLGAAGTVVTIRGQHLSDTTAVIFGKAGTVPEDVSETEVRCTVPAGATTSRPRLVVGEGLVYAPAKFRVTGQPPASPTPPPTQ